MSLTTLRACLRSGCGHGASAHKNRSRNYLPYRAECEHCDCDDYVDPVVTTATRYNDEGKPINNLEDLPAPRHYTPSLHAKPEPLIRTTEEQRVYWRLKQRQSRARRRMETALGEQR